MVAIFFPSNIPAFRDILGLFEKTMPALLGEKNVKGEKKLLITSSLPFVTKWLVLRVAKPLVLRLFYVTAKTVPMILPQFWRRGSWPVMCLFNTAALFSWTSATQFLGST